MNGQGTYFYPFGNTYIGEWKNGKKKEKEFTYIRSEGNMLDWVNDKKHGRGFSTDGQGNSYKGDFLDGEMEGEGAYTFKSGNTY